MVDKIINKLIFSNHVAREAVGESHIMSYLVILILTNWISFVVSMYSLYKNYHARLMVIFFVVLVDIVSTNGDGII